jgi:hypothetical protein
MVSSYNLYLFKTNTYNQGEIVIGGYNAARVTGDWVNFTINDTGLVLGIPCALRVNVTGVTLNNINGAVPILGAGQTITACVDPLQNAFTFPDDMYNVWAAATNHTFDSIPGQDNFTYQTYLTSNEKFMNTLQIQIQGINDVFTTTVPHYELVVPNRGSNPNQSGAYTILKDDQIQSAVSSGPTDYGENFGMLLGGVFASGLYMRIDYERGILSIAKANLGSSDSDIRTVCSLDTTVPPPPSSTSDAPSSHSTANSNNSSNSGLDSGAKAGIAVGVVGAVGTIIAVFIAIYQTKWIRKQSRTHFSFSVKSSSNGLDLQQTPTIDTMISPLASPNILAKEQTQTEIRELTPLPESQIES